MGMAVTQEFVPRPIESIVQAGSKVKAEIIKNKALSDPEPFS
jgi:hypothetical protein